MLSQIKHQQERQLSYRPSPLASPPPDSPLPSQPEGTPLQQEVPKEEHPLSSDPSRPGPRFGIHPRTISVPNSLALYGDSQIRSYLNNPTGRVEASDITEIEPKPNLWKVGYYSVMFIANRVSMYVDPAYIDPLTYRPYPPFVGCQYCYEGWGWSNSNNRGTPYIDKKK